MNRDEYTQWAKYHSGLFQGFQAWYAKMPDEAVEVWRDGLADVELRHAKAASKEMAIGEIDPPNGFGRHLPAIRKRARDLAYSDRPVNSMIVGGQRAYRCPVCLDEGVVPIYHPRFIAALIDGLEGPDAFRLVQTCNARCNCGAGRRWGSLTEFVENEMIRWKIRGARCDAPMIRCTYPSAYDGMLNEAIDGVDAFMNRNRVTAFDDFNEGVSDEQMAN